MFEEKYFKINEWNLYYSIIGNGPHVVLCCIGGLSHSRDILKHQIEGFNLEKFTLVIWDPPGHPKSRPPEREITKSVYSENADYAFSLMKALNFDRYSVWGHCSGGTSAMILAASHPEVMRALVLLNTRSHILTSDVEIISSYKHVESWGEKIFQIHMNTYGKELFQKIWTSWVEAVQKVYKENRGNICADVLRDIKCPTLVVGGGQDFYLDRSHPYYLHEHIRGSKLYVDPEGEHCYHVSKPEKFNRMVQDFLLEF